MEISRQLLPYHNPWTDTWHKTIGDPTPGEDYPWTPNGYLTHHRYTGELVHIPGITSPEAEQLRKSEDQYSNIANKYLDQVRYVPVEKRNQALIEKRYNDVLAMHGGDHQKAQFTIQRAAKDSDDIARRGEMEGERRLGIMGRNEYASSQYHFAQRAFDLPSIYFPPKFTPSLTVSKKELINE